MYPSNRPNDLAFTGGQRLLDQPVAHDKHAALAAQLFEALPPPESLSRGILL